jgi:hypothetical protein
METGGVFRMIFPVRAQIDVSVLCFPRRLKTLMLSLGLGPHPNDFGSDPKWCWGPRNWKMDAQQALEAYIADLPKPHPVWRWIEETPPHEPLTVLVTVTPETAPKWLQRRVSPAEPDRRHGQMLRSADAGGNVSPT